MLKEFMDFIKKGNVLDLAVAVIVGGAFGSIVNSLVADIIMPLLGIITGRIDLTSLALNVGSASLTYGNFLQAIINFLVIALVIFLLIKQAKRFEKPSEVVTAPPEPSAGEKLLTEIRDLIKERT